MTPSRPNDRPRLCFVGPLAGSAHGYVVTQGVRLSRHFRDAGYEVTAVSASPNRYVRLIDITLTLLRRRRAIDIVILHVYGGPSFVVEDIASRIAKRSGHRLIQLLHGGALPEFMERFPLWTARVLKRADAIIAPSPYLARAVGARGFSCDVIPNVIDIRRYPYRPRCDVAPRLFWMRTFHPVYNPLMAIRVLERLRADHPEATLNMAGQDKGMRAEVEQCARQRGVDKAVRFPGFLGMADKVREAAEADIFINTSHVDNMPVAVIEAGALGLPVVSTTVGGIADLLTDGETALLIRDDDAEGMVAAIRRLLKDPGLAGRLSAAGRRLAEKSGWEQVRPRWERLFSSLTDSSGSHDKERQNVRD